jgi:hypothetical protein
MSGQYVAYSTTEGKGRGWSWATLVGLVLVLAAMAPTWGLSVFMWPMTLALSVVAWFRSDRERVFWLGVAWNLVLVAMSATFLL